MTERVVVEGVTRWMRSERDPHHVFCYTVDLDPWRNRYAGLESQQDSVSWLHKAIQQMPENARIRLSVESVQHQTVDALRPVKESSDLAAMRAKLRALAALADDFEMLGDSRVSQLDETERKVYTAVAFKMYQRLALREAIGDA